MVAKKCIFLVSISLLFRLIEAVPHARDLMKDLILHDNGTDIIQLSVPHQSSMENGNASCAYQAVFNGLSILDCLIAPEGEHSRKLNVLKDVLLRHDTFCKYDSPWRKAISLSRSLKEAKKMLETQIGMSFKGAAILNASDRKENKRYRSVPQENVLVEFPAAQSDHEALLRDTLWSENCNVALARSLHHKETLGGFLSYKVSAGEIKTQFLERLTTRKNDDKIKNKALKALYEELSSDSRLSEFVDFREATVHVPLCRDTDWLESNEIELLLAQQKNLDMSTVYVLSDIQADKPLLEHPTLTTSKTFKDFVAHYQVDGGAQMGMFIIYLKDLESASADVNDTDSLSAFTDQATQSNTSGHWVCVVAHKVGNERQLIIADSLGNPSRIEHIRIKELECLLQGSDYVKDGRFADWVKKVRTKPFLYRVADISRQRPYTTTLMVGLVAILIRYGIQNYTFQKADYRSPDIIIEPDIAPIEVH